MAPLASDWLRYFRLLLWNRWTEFNETWQEARSQRPLASLCFWGRSEKQDGRPGLWLAETFSTSPLKLLNGIQRNLTGSKISMSSTKFVFLMPIGKIRWPPLPLIGWVIFDFSSETTGRNSKKLDRKQVFNVLYQVCFFRPISKQKWPRWLIPQKGSILYSGARYVALWASCLPEILVTTFYLYALLLAIRKRITVIRNDMEEFNLWLGSISEVYFRYSESSIRHWLGSSEWILPSLTRKFRMNFTKFAEWSFGKRSNTPSRHSVFPNHKCWVIYPEFPSKSELHSAFLCTGYSLVSVHLYRWRPTLTMNEA